MATIRRFEDIEAWRKAKGLTCEVYRLSKTGSFSRDFGLRDQVRKAAVSIMSNIAEGFERDGTAEFIQFLSIAKGSAGELRSQLYVALEQGYVTVEEFERLRELASETSRMINGLMGYLARTGMRGVKFKSGRSRKET